MAKKQQPNQPSENVIANPLEELRAKLLEKVTELKSMYEAKAPTHQFFKEKCFVQFVDENGDYWYLRYQFGEKSPISLRINEKKGDTARLEPKACFQRFEDRLKASSLLDRTKKMGGEYHNF